MFSILPLSKISKIKPHIALQVVVVQILAQILLHNNSQAAGQTTASWSAATTHWQNPPTVCVEEMFPLPPTKSCPNYSGLTDIFKEWPSNYGADEIEWWKSRKGELRTCRAKEVLRREAAAAGTYSGGQVQSSWLSVLASQNTDVKIASIYEASRKYGVPERVLAGALKQESGFAQTGVESDGGNYSCGVGQLNIKEWCRWVQTLTADEKSKMSWPTDLVSCSNLVPKTMELPYEMAVENLKGLSKYKIDKSHFDKINWDEARNKLSQLDNTEFQAVLSFVQNCQDGKYGIFAKAHELSLLFEEFIPKGLKEAQLLTEQDQQEPLNSTVQCRGKGQTKYYPLHIGWLLAVGMYNAGPGALDLVTNYYGMTADSMNDPKTWQNINPQTLVEALYWSGEYKADTHRISLQGFEGNPVSWPWYKACVLHKHVANVADNAVRSSAGAKVTSYDGELGCQRSEATGERIKKDRKESSGRYEPGTHDGKSGSSKTTENKPENKKKSWWEFGL